MLLTDRYDERMEWRGKELKLNLSFDTILLALDLADDHDFSEEEKADIYAEMFVRNKEALGEIGIEEKAELVNTIFESLNDGDSGSKGGKKVFCFRQDAELIYASFLYDYGIDLFEMHGKLHWKKFLALLKGLSENTAFKKVIDIRTRKIPKATKYNREEIRELRELKRIHRLKLSPEEEKREILRHNEEQFAKLDSLLRPKG